MFTGIIEETGRIITVGSSSLSVQAYKVLEGTVTGDSIAVNGVCLTVRELTASGFEADVSSETWKRTSLGGLAAGKVVNLERAVTPSTRMGGHIVQGHVDCAGSVESIRKEGAFVRLALRLPEEYAGNIVTKGSVAVDGISLTVASIDSEKPLVFSAALIPRTFEETNLHALKKGERVNIELDIVGKYIERMMNMNKKENISIDYLRRMGF